MRRLSFALTIAGMFILLILLNFQSPITVNSPSDLSSLEQNTKVQTQGKVLSERQYQTTKTLKLDNDIEILCNTCKSQINRTIRVIGTIERYQNKTQIQALKITFP
jgi:hypothetical protein